MDIGGEGGIPIDTQQNDGYQPANLSDVLEVISHTEASFGAGSGAAMSSRLQNRVSASVEIVEQPASKALRFRYECEGRSAGSIPGANSTPENKTFPTIKIRGYVGPVTIVVSCVTKDEPYRPHPHNLVGRERCEKGVCSIKANITEESNTYQFKNLGIQCVKRRDIAEALQLRADLRVDPFRTGFEHKNHPQSIDLNAVRLAFQVFVPNSNGEMRCQLAPVCSEVIYDKKAMCELQIVRASHCSGALCGGTKVILLCEKVTREDTAVVFFQEEQGRVVWEQPATTILVHKQVAIAFETPPYPRPAPPSGHVNVRFQLKRVTDNARSNDLPFEYTPDYRDSHYLGIKKRKTLVPSIPTYESERMFHLEHIKAEPDKTPPHMSTSPHRVYSPQYEQNWAAMVTEPSHASLTVPGPSHVTFGLDMQWSTSYAGQGAQHLGAYSPGMGHASPHLGAQTPSMGHVSPHLGAHSPGLGHVSPHLGAPSPSMGHVSPHLGPHSPNMGHVSPNLGSHSPNVGQMMCNMGQMIPGTMGHVLPSMGSHSPNPCQVVPNLEPQHNFSHQQQQQQQPAGSGSGEGPLPVALSSGELSGLISSMLADRNPDLSDSLNRLSTSDLLL